MKTIFKLLIVAVAINALVRGGAAAWNYYELKDATTQLLTFGDQASTNALANHIVDKARELRVPLIPQDVTVHRQGTRTWAEASYTEIVELFPNYPYPMKFSFKIENYSVFPGKQEEPAAN